MGDNIQRCPCCKTCEECPYFQSVVNVKSAGLLIYRYSCVQGVNIYTGKNESSTEIFILHNTKNNEITSEKLLPRLGQYKKCPRCKYILEHAEKILLSVSTVNKLDVLGICDKCRNKDRKGISFCECSQAIEKFIAIIKSNKKEATKGKQRQFKLQKLLNFFNNKDVESKTLRARTRSDSNLDKIICHANSKKKCEPKVDQLIVVKKESCGTNRTEIQGRIPISKTARRILYADEKYNSIDHDATSFQPFAKTDKDYPLRRISVSEESLFSFYDLLDKPDGHPKKKFDSLRLPTHVQKEPRLDEDKTPSILDLIAAQNRYRKEYSKMDTHEFDTKRTSAVMGTGILKTKVETTLPPDKLPEYKSGEAFSSSLLAKTNELLHKDFSYFFIKEAELKKKPIQKHKSSSELIKDTQDMLLAREEDLKRKYEEELKRKLDEEEKKRKAREEKIKLLKESKTILEKDKGKKEGKDDPEKLDVSSKKSISIEKLSKDVRSSEKSRKSGIKADSKGDKIVEGKSKRYQNEKEEQEKDSYLRLEKERKLREKEELSTKETREKYKKQSTREKERRESSDKQKKDKPVKDKEIREIDKKEPSEKEKKDKFLKDKETREKYEKEPSEKVREKSEIDGKTREQQKYEIDRNEKPKRNKEKGEKFGKEEIMDENLKNVIIEKRKNDEKEMERNKFPVDMKKAKEDAASKLKALREVEDQAENFQQRPKPVQQIEEPKIKELNINQVKVKKPSHDDLILQLVKLKQTGETRKRPRSIAEFHIPLTLITDHKKDHKNIKHATCAICNDSELELDIEEIILNKAEKVEINNIIIGQKIFKFKQPLKEKSDEKQIFPLFMSIFNDDLINVPENNTNDKSEKLERKPPAMLGKYVSLHSYLI